MHFNGNLAVLEADDIAAVEQTGAIVDLPDGRQALPVLLVIDPASGKHYEPGTAPASVHMTNGVVHRLLHLVESLFRTHAPAAPAAPAAAPAEAPAADAPEAPTAADAPVVSGATNDIPDIPDIPDPAPETETSA